MPKREEWGITNYPTRGPRGRMGIGVRHMDMDSEGNI